MVDRIQCVLYRGKGVATHCQTCIDRTCGRIIRTAAAQSTGGTVAHAVQLAFVYRITCIHTGGNIAQGIATKTHIVIGDGDGAATIADSHAIQSVFAKIAGIIYIYNRQACSGINDRVLTISALKIQFCGR